MTIAAGAGLVVLGAAVGAFGTLIGAGGGFILVPLLLLLLRLPHPTAVGTSLALVFLNAASGTVAYLGQRRVDLTLGWKFALATVPGAVLGAFASRALTTSAFSLTFGVVLVAIALVLAWGRTLAPSRRAGLRQLVDLGGDTHAYSYNLPAGVATSTGVGFLSSLLGIGGGVIHVPIMVRVLRFPAHIATATSHYVLMVSAFAGTLVHVSTGQLDGGYGITAALAAGVLVGAQAGARLSNRIQGDLLIRLLGAALAVTSVRLLIGAAIG